jgi:hypothetical protein
MTSAVAYSDSLPVASAPPRLQARWRLLTLFLIIAVGVSLDASTLFKTPYAVGADGYYYVLQIDELLNRGHFYFPSYTPLILYALAGVSYLVGDPVVSVKIASIALHAALCLGLFAVIASLTRSWWLGVVASALAAVLGAHLYMIAEYINQLGALVFLIWGGWCALRAFNTRRKAWTLLSVACLVAASFSHRSAFPLVLVSAALVVLVRLLYAEPVNRTYRLVVLALLFLLWYAPMILVIQPFVTLPQCVEMEITAPGLPLSKTTAPEQIILMVLSPLALVVVFREKDESRDRISTLALGSVALWSFLVTINPFLDHSRPDNLTSRLSILAYIQIAILVPGVIWLTHKRPKVIALMAAFVLPLVAGSRVYSQPFGLRTDYLSARAALLRRLPLYRQQLEPNPLVISPHGEQFLVTHALGVTSQQRLPGHSQSQPIYWLLHRVRSNFFLPSMLVIMKEREGFYTILAKDADVSQQLESISDAERGWILMNNPPLKEEVIRRGQTEGVTPPNPSRD